jgi:hypothetical protein
MSCVMLSSLVMRLRRSSKEHQVLCATEGRGVEHRNDAKCGKAGKVSDGVLLKVFYWGGGGINTI